MDSHFWHRLELLLAIALMALSLVLAGRTAFAMATTSLSTDEFGTVGTFSSKGPLRVVTDYRAPKNHVFFNLLNSILPDRKSLNPARVRALSILATLLTAAAIIAFSAWRQRWLEGAVLLALWSSAPQMLRVSMEARGYGFLGFFAVIAAICVIEYLRTKRRAWLGGLAAACALGVYTLPNFLFFAGPLLAILWLIDRTRWSFLAGAATAAAILLLYAPILGQLIRAFTSYDVQGSDEADFRSLHGLVVATKLYLFSGEDWQAWALLAALALAPFVPFRNREGAALRVIAAAGIAFFVILLVLRTPPLRVAAFCLLPLGLSGFWAIGALMRDHLPAFVRVPLCGVVGIFLGLHLTGAIRTFQFTPTEDWLLAARAIDTAFPKSTRVDFKRYAKYLDRTLPDAAERTSDFDPAAFANGQLIVADAGNKWAEGRRFTPPADMPDTAQWIIPGTIRDLILSFRLPEPVEIAGAPEALTDRNAKTGVDLPSEGLKLRLTPSAEARVLLVLFDRSFAQNEIHIETTPHRDGVFVAGNAVVIPLQAGIPTQIVLRSSQGQNLRAAEVLVTHDEPVRRP